MLCWLGLHRWRIPALGMLYAKIYGVGGCFEVCERCGAQRAIPRLGS